MAGTSFYNSGENKLPCEVHIDSGDQKVAAYGIEIYYSSRIIEPDTYYGTQGVEAGPDGYMAAVGVYSGYFDITGFDVNGTGSGYRDKYRVEDY